MRRTRPVMDRFNEKVKRTDSCWLWTGALDGHGYGHFWYKGKVRKAYRAAYDMFIGEVPEGLQLDHTCRVRSCVNPWHLEPVTQRENILRGVSLSAQAAVKTHCIRGHEFTPENTYVYARTGARYCRTCKRARDRAYQAMQLVGAS